MEKPRYMFAFEKYDFSDIDKMEDDIADILREWCEKNYYTHFIIWLKLDNEIVNVLCEYTNPDELIFEWDFYEGQKCVEFIGYIPIDDVPIVENVKKVVLQK